jgi:hypothetical protein
MQFAVAVMGGIIATVAHSSKTVTRVIAAEGGIPVPSIAMNGSGDVVAIALAWLASEHPVISGITVVVVLVLMVFLVRHAYRAMRHEFTTLHRRCSDWWAAHRRRHADLPLKIE